MALLRSDAVAQCAVDRGSKMRIKDQGSVALLRCCAVAQLRSGAVAHCAVRGGSRIEDEDRGSVALLFALCEREREGKRVRTLK